jgi:hypothetical protein
MTSGKPGKKIRLSFYTKYINHLKETKMETINWSNIKSCCDEMESCSFLSERNKSKEETKTDIEKVIVNCKDVMKEKMENNKKHVVKRVKWIMLLPGLILISAFLLTFFLNPEAVQIFWLVITGTLIALGFLFMLMIPRWFSNIKKQIKA